jgi:hypothetical protein
MIKNAVFVVSFACASIFMFGACSHNDSSTGDDENAIPGFSNKVSTNQNKGTAITVDGTAVKIHVNKGSITYRICLDIDNSNNCTKPTIQDEEGDYNLKKLGMVNDLFTEAEAKSDENCKTSAVGYDTCKKQGDYYNLAKTACKKTGGSLPTINQLITLKKYASSLFPWGMFTWASEVLTTAEGPFDVGSWYQMYSDGEETDPKVHIHDNNTSDKGVGNIQVLCISK